jgi:long-chain fatty acid transport protein
MHKTRVFAFAALVTTALAAEAHAGGFYLQEQSVRGTGRAYSGEVADTGVASLWWNPAAIARSGREAYVGLNSVFVGGNVVDHGSTITYPLGNTVPVGGLPRANKPISPGLLPNFAIATPIGDRFAVGVSVTAPFNFTTKYEPNSFTRFDALTSNLRTIDSQLTAAMKITDWLDLGVSANAEYVDARLTGALPNFFSFQPDATNELSGNGWNWGWGVGAQAHFDRLTIAASYKSKINHTLKGDVSVGGLLPPLPTSLNGSTGASATFATPWIAAFGVRYALTDQLTLNGQVQRIGWGGFNAIQINSAPLLSQTVPEGYHDVTTGGVGLDYAVNPALTLRAGVQYDPTPTPKDNPSFRVPDSNRWLYGVGATGTVNDHLKIDAALLYIDLKSRTINRTDVFNAGTLAETTTNLSGSVKGSGFVLSLGTRMSF